MLQLNTVHGCRQQIESDGYFQVMRGGSSARHMETDESHLFILTLTSVSTNQKVGTMQPLTSDSAATQWTQEVAQNLTTSAPLPAIMIGGMDYIRSNLWGMLKIWSKKIPYHVIR